MKIKLYDSHGRLMDKTFLTDEEDVIFVTAKDRDRMNSIHKEILDDLKNVNSKDSDAYKFILVNNRLLMYSTKHYEDDFGGTDKVGGIEVFYNHADGEICDLYYFMTTPASWNDRRHMDIRINIRDFGSQNKDDEEHFPGLEDVIAGMESRHRIISCDRYAYVKNMYILNVSRYTRCDRKYRWSVFSALKKLDEKVHYNARDVFYFNTGGDDYTAALRENILYCRGNIYKSLDGFLLSIKDGTISKTDEKTYGPIDETFRGFLQNSAF